MNLPNSIEPEGLLFDKLLEPLDQSLETLDQSFISQSAGKLRFRLFIRLLLFRLFARIESLRDLVQDLRTAELCQQVGFPRLGLSTFHDAFARYSADMLQQLWAALISQSEFLRIPELKSFGELAAVDSSFWRVRRLSWLERAQLRGVRLHLSFSLNRMLTVAFLCSFDQSPSINERRCLRQLIERGTTYILDRGYLERRLCREMIERGAFFVLRWRETMRYRVLAEMEVEESAMSAAVGPITDQVVQLAATGGEPCRSDETVLRLVRAQIKGRWFLLLTNRFDLTAEEILRLYAWRWQVELIFRAFKHTFKGLHLINYSENGIRIQFYVLVIASLLWSRFEQQHVRQRAPTEEKRKPPRPKTLTERLSQLLQVSWRLKKNRLRLLGNCLGKPVSCYMKEVIEQRV